MTAEPQHRYLYVRWESDPDGPITLLVDELIEETGDHLAELLTADSSGPADTVLVEVGTPADRQQIIAKASEAVEAVVRAHIGPTVNPKTLVATVVDTTQAANPLPDATTGDPRRDWLIGLCEAGTVAQDRWRNRDTANAQQQLGRAWALLRAGADYQIRPAPARAGTDNWTVWLEITYKGFDYFEDGEERTDTFYLPTVERLKEAGGGDWY